MIECIQFIWSLTLLVHLEIAICASLKRSSRVNSLLPSLIWDYSLSQSCRLSHKHNSQLLHNSHIAPNSAFTFTSAALDMYSIWSVRCIFALGCGLAWSSTGRIFDPGRLMWTYFILREEEDCCAGGPGIAIWRFEKMVREKFSVIYWGWHV